jgi:hypothetical protein
MVVGAAKHRSGQTAALEILVRFLLLLFIAFVFVECHVKICYLRETVAYYLDYHKMICHSRMEVICYAKTSFSLCRGLL